jgi:hypothetical protein
MAKVNVRNRGSKEFPFFQVFVNGREYCATDDLLKATTLRKLLKEHFKDEPNTIGSI